MTGPHYVWPVPELLKIGCVFVYTQHLYLHLFQRLNDRLVLAVNYQKLQQNNHNFSTHFSLLRRISAQLHPWLNQVIIIYFLIIYY